MSRGCSRPTGTTRGDGTCEMAEGFTVFLANRCEGPYRVNKRLSRLSYKRTHCGPGEVCGSVYITDLKLFHEPEELDALQILNGDGTDHVSEVFTASPPSSILGRRSGQRTQQGRQT